MLLVAAACSRPLPDPSSPEAKVYAERCGVCHRPHAPGLLALPAWLAILPRMERRIREARLPPLTPEERAAILEYLRRHAGSGR